MASYEVCITSVLLIPQLHPLSVSHASLPFPCTVQLYMSWSIFAGHAGLIAVGAMTEEEKNISILRSSYTQNHRSLLATSLDEKASFWFSGRSDLRQ